MPTLIISAPWYKKDSAGNPTGRPGQPHSWETYFQTHVGLGYVLYPAEFNRLSGAIGSAKVVLLRNDKKKLRAEARLTGLTRRRQTKNGQWRYDVSFEDPREIKPYVYYPEEKLKENGVKVI
jgi:hypothetical protein